MEIGKKNFLANNYNNIGNLYDRKKEYQKALKYYEYALKIRETINDKHGIAGSYSSIGQIYISLNNFNMALFYLQKGVEIAKEINANERIRDNYAGISKTYAKMKNYKNAYEYHLLYFQLNDSIFNEKSSKQITEMQTRYESEKKQKEIELLQKDKALKETEIAKKDAEVKKQNIQKIAFGVGFVLMLVIAFLAMFSYRKIKGQKKLIVEKNEALNQQNEEISTQRDEIVVQRDLVTKQKEHIEEIYQEISDSINYAKRIQQAVLPTSEYANKILGEHFILFKPKDVVSGDFYWTTKINEFIFVIVADCTGHGVPGAFMSMLGISFLNEIVRKKEITQASQVLDQLRNSVIDALKQQGMAGEQKDGMDLVFVVINTITIEMQFAGANNPLYLIKNDNFELQEVKPDKMPVAIYENMKPFTNNVIQLQKGDIIYLATDGYEDQFGGPKGKKFMSKKLKQLITENCIKPMSEQNEILDKTINDWKNSYGEKYEQIDDITVMGIRI